jgi:molybdenum cofactor biosynthesis enzyme MoaA
VSFGRACDGEPLSRIRVLEEAISLVRARVPRAAIHLETAGSDAAALRRAAGAGLANVTVRLGSARAETYERLHRPVAHRWSDVRASLQVAVEHRLAITVALLVLPGLTDRGAEIDAILALLGELPSGVLELRDLGADPLRTLSQFAPARASGVRTLLDRIAEADHFRMRAPAAAAV